MIIWGEPGKPEKLRLIHKWGELIEENADLDLLREKVKAWYQWADDR